ncbi:MAG: class I SAM-dependent methyltransferase [Betaproteobacteria bacterium]|nr:class I SAM-dependent methyltransferase [Betaproteobacteria bacterium]
MKFTRLLFAIAGAILPFALQAQSWAWDDGTVPYVQTPMEIVERMLRMAEVHTGDYVIDLGSGDGRIIVEAAKRGARGLGVDLDPNLVNLATRNAQQARVGDKARFEVRDIFETDLSRASVVTMYLLPDFNAKLLPRLLALKPGTRIVSHDGGIGDWPADETLAMRTPEKPVGVGGNSKVELWIVPADVHGDWIAELSGHGGAWRFHIDQHYQMLEVKAQTQGRELLVRNTRLRGEQVKLVVTGLVGNRPWHHYFVGQARGDAIDGEVTVSTGKEQTVYPWHAKRAP